MKTVKEITPMEQLKKRLFDSSIVYKPLTLEEMDGYIEKEKQWKGSVCNADDSKDEPSVFSWDEFYKNLPNECLIKTEPEDDNVCRGYNACKICWRG